ncbi:MAG: FecR family protein, partial [Gemmatimonadaceae bacterium]
LLNRSGGNTTWGPVDVVTGASEMTTVQLPDGSVVRLAPASRIRFTASTTVRELTLDGRAYFAVARIPGRPFVVRTRLGDAQVLGTRFELTAEHDSLRLLVVEGRVALSAGGERVEVRAGQQSGARGGAPLPATFVADRARMHEWVGKYLVFQATGMVDVAREINETYGVRLVLTDSMIAHRTVTAKFMDWRGDQVVDVICSIVGASCESRAGVIVMTSNSPAEPR